LFGFFFAFRRAVNDMSSASPRFVKSTEVIELDSLEEAAERYLVGDDDQTGGGSYKHDNEEDADYDDDDDNEEAKNIGNDNTTLYSQKQEYSRAEIEEYLCNAAGSTRKMVEAMRDQLSANTREIMELRKMVEILVATMKRWSCTTPAVLKAVYEKLRTFFRTSLVFEDPWADDDTSIKNLFFPFLRAAGEENPNGPLAMVDCSGLDMKELRKKLQNERAQFGSMIRSAFTSHPVWFPSGSPKPPSLDNQGAPTPIKTKESREADAQKWHSYVKDMVPVGI